MPFDLKMLRQFQAVARHGSVSDAARTLGLTQPAVSMGIAKFEKALGVRMFARISSRLVLTPAGSAALGHADEILDAVERFERDMERRKSQGRELRIAFCDPGPQWFLLPRYRMLKAEPESIEVREFALPESDDPAKLLVYGEFDAVVTDRKIDGSELESRLLVRDEHYLSLPEGHALSDKEEMDLSEAPAMPVLFYTVNGTFAKRFEAYLASKAPQIALQKETDYFQFQERLRRSNAVTFTTSLVRHYRFDGMNRREVLLTGEGTSIDYWISWKKPAGATLHGFLEFSRELLKSSGFGVGAFETQSS